MDDILFRSKCCVSGSGLIKSKGSIGFRIKVISWIWIRINLQMLSQNVLNMSLFEHFFKVLNLYLEARIRIRIGIRIEMMRIHKTAVS